MGETPRKCGEDLCEGAVRLVRETGKPSRRWPETSGSTRVRCKLGKRRQAPAP
jgi:hypothetical protein